MSYIQLNHVMKKFGDVIAIEDLNLSIEKGECFSMLGPSGCGKTLRMIAGFEDLDGGEIKVGDKLLSSKKNNFYLPPEKRNFGMVFQAFAVWPHMTVYDNVAFPLKLKNISAQEIEKRTTDALRHTNLLSVAKKSPAGQRHAAGQARGLDAHEVDGIGCHVVPDLHLPVLNSAVLIHPLGLDAGEGADLILFKDVGPQLCALHGQTVHVGLRHAVVVQHIGVLGIRAHGDVAVHGGGDTFNIS